MKFFLYKIKEIWMRFAQTLGKINTIILLSLVYIFVIGLMALLTRLFRKDLLEKRIHADRVTFWSSRNSVEPTVGRNKFQF